MFFSLYFSLSSFSPLNHYLCLVMVTLTFPGFFFFFYTFILVFIYLFLAGLDLRCCAQSFSSCCERGLLFVAVHGLLVAVASLVAEHGL